MHCVVSAKMFGAFAPPSIGRYNDKWSVYPSENSEERTTVRGHHEEMIAPAQTENLASLAHLDLEQEIVRLKREMNAVILAHYYQDSEIQDLVIVRQDDGIHLALEPHNLLFKIEVRQGGQILGLCRCDHFFVVTPYGGPLLRILTRVEAPLIIIAANRRGSKGPEHLSRYNTVHCADFHRGVSIESAQKTLGVNLGREIPRESHQEKDFGPGTQPRIFENYCRPFCDSTL